MNKNAFVLSTLISASINIFTMEVTGEPTTPVISLTSGKVYEQTANDIFIANMLIDLSKKDDASTTKQKVQDYTTPKEPKQKTEKKKNLTFSEKVIIAVNKSFKRDGTWAKDGKLSPDLIKALQNHKKIDVNLYTIAVRGRLPRTLGEIAVEYRAQDAITYMMKKRDLIITPTMKKIAEQLPHNSRVRNIILKSQTSHQIVGTAHILQNQNAITQQ